MVCHETTDALIEAAHHARPVTHDWDPRAARRWVNRRLERTALLLALIPALWPHRFLGLTGRIKAYREHLKTECVLITLRMVCIDHLEALPAPIGFRRRVAREAPPSGAASAAGGVAASCGKLTGFRRTLNGVGSQTGPPTRVDPCSSPSVSA